MYVNDWISRQINALVNMIAKIILGKDSISFIENTENISESELSLYEKLIVLIESLKINEAEDLLFDYLDYDNVRGLSLAIDFYSRLNKLSDEELEKSNFSREEIKQGIDDILNMYKLDILL